MARNVTERDAQERVRAAREKFKEEKITVIHGGDKRHADDIIKDWKRAKYEPVYRAGGKFWSATEKRFIRPGDIIPDKEIIEELKGALEAPKNDDGSVKVSALPQVFNTWYKIGFGELLKELPIEEDVLVADQDAGERFKMNVRNLITTMVTLAWEREKEGPQRQERRTVLSWLITFTKSDNRLNTWQRLRSYDCWGRRNKAGELEIAFTTTLAARGQLGSCQEIAGETQNRLGRLAAQYEIGKAGKVYCGGREHRAVTLTPEFVAECAPDDEAPQEFA